MTRATHNGTCQVCGREQAVNPKTGHLAKHGYTVEYGYFQGTCPGANRAPLQVETTIAKQAVADVTEQAEKYDAIAAGEIECESYPMHLGGKPHLGFKGRAVAVTRESFDELREEYPRDFRIQGASQWADLAERARKIAPLHARSCRDFVAALQERIESVYGTDLIERK